MYLSCGGLALSMIFNSATYSQTLYPYKNKALSVKKRVDDLIGRMTLEEKIFQLQSQLLFLPRIQQTGFQGWKRSEYWSFSAPECNKSGFCNRLC